MDIRVAAYGVIVDAGKILLAHWNEAGHSGWTLPGGGLEPYETCEQAAVREIREETGYDAELGNLLGVDSRFVEPADRFEPHERPLHALRVIYRARITGGALADEADGTTDEARWFPLDGLGTLDLTSVVTAGLMLQDRSAGQDPQLAV